MMLDQFYVHITKKENIFGRRLFREKKIKIKANNGSVNDETFKRFASCFSSIISDDDQCIVYPIVFFNSSENFESGELTTKVMSVVNKFFTEEQQLVAVAIVYIGEGRFHRDGGHEYRNQFSRNPEIHGANGFADEFANTKYKYNVLVMTKRIWDAYCAEVEPTC